MRILIISPAFPPLRSGGADFTYCLAKELSQASLDVHVLTSSGLSCDKIPNVHAVMPDWGWRSMNACLNAVAAIKPDVVDIHFTGWVYHDHPMVTFLATAIKRRHPHVRVITHIESLGGVKRQASSLPTAAIRMLVSLWAGREYIGFDYGTLLRDSDWLIVLSERDRSELEGYYANLASKCSVIPPPPLLPVLPSISPEQRAKTRLELGADGDCILIAFFGYLYPGKGLETLFQALRLLVDNGHRLKLALIGDTPAQYVLDRAGVPDYLDQLKAHARELSLDDGTIQWLEYMPCDSQEPSRILNSCDLGVLPFDHGIISSNSSFAFMAAHALPVVSTRALKPQPPFEDGRNILFCPPKDPVLLKEKIQSLIQDQSLRKAIGQEALIMQKHTFSWSNTIEETLKAYRLSFETSTAGSVGRSAGRTAGRSISAASISGERNRKNGIGRSIDE